MERPIHHLTDAIAAIESLTPAQMYSLLAYARSAAYIDEETARDLVQEAILRTLTGSRVWYVNAGKDITYHLTGVIRSLANEYRHSWWRQIQQRPADNLATDSQLYLDALDRISALDKLVSNDCPSRTYEVAEMRRSCFRLLTREEDRRIFFCRLAGMDEREIQTRLGIPEARYNAARKRINRYLAPLREAA